MFIQLFAHAYCLLACLSILFDALLSHDFAFVILSKNTCLNPRFPKFLLPLFSLIFIFKIIYLKSRITHKSLCWFIRHIHTLWSVPGWSQQTGTPFASPMRVAGVPAFELSSLTSRCTSGELGQLLLKWTVYEGLFIIVKVPDLIQGLTCSVQIAG